MTKKDKRRRVEPTGDPTETAPIGLGAFSGGKLQSEIGGLAHRANQTHEVFENAVGPGVAPSLKLLEDLLGAVRMTFEHGHDLAFERIELAGPLDRTALLIGGARDPFFNGLKVQLQFGRDLGLRDIGRIAGDEDFQPLEERFAAAVGVAMSQ